MSIYYATKQFPRTHQLTLDEFLFHPEIHGGVIAMCKACTYTYVWEDHVPEWCSHRFSVDGLKRILKQYVSTKTTLYDTPREKLYHSFYIPKKKGGLRRIDQPVPELMEALRELKVIFERDFHALHHTSAFAYVRERSAIDSVKRHQQNKSRWFAKLDLSNFFGSVTLDYTVRMLEMIFPFSEVFKDDEGRRYLTKALELGFLNGGLPQGTPLSPMLTNLIMIPMDFEFSNTLRNFHRQRYVYTRYADDFLISSKFDFKCEDIEQYVESVLRKFEAPFKLNRSKTRYGSSAGSNWNLGVMLNKDNQITIGHRKKKQFESMLTSYARDKKSGRDWTLEDVRVLDGLRSYYTMVEGDVIRRIVSYISQKQEFDIMRNIKMDLKSTH